jgi:hypothetical protein
MNASEGRLTEIVSVRFTAGEVEHLRILAAGRPLSHVVRELSLQAADTARPSLRGRAITQTSEGTDSLSITMNTPIWSAPEISNTVPLPGGMPITGRA